MPPDPARLAKDVFGFETLLDGQHQVISHLLAGKSAAAIFPTGGGKSLCYQLPALTFDGLTLVVSPLLALMKDQIDALRARGILAHRLDSTLSLDESRTVLDDIRHRRAKLLYVAPERFNNERFVASLNTWQISLFAIDEAHCISEWGHNFRPDYLKLKDIADACGAERILALTATATPKVIEDIQSGFHVDSECIVRTPFYRPNLALWLTPTEADAKLGALKEAITSRPRGATLVYVTLQKTAERVAQWLSNQGIAATAYHAGMKPEDRTAVQDAFIADDAGIVVATIAFGMGVDKRDIRAVFHYDLPKSLENLAQEIGRAGRDGAAAHCEVLVCPGDLNALENFAYGDTPTKESIEALLDEVFHGPVDDRGDRLLDLYTLSKTTDIRPLVLKTLLTWLELDGILRAGTPLYAAYRMKPARSGAEILAAIGDDETRGFVRAIFMQGKKKTTWIDLDIDASVRATGSSREDVVAALERLAERGELELAPSGVRHRTRVMVAVDDVAALAAEFAARMEARESAEIRRLDAVCSLAALDGCQVRALGNYFGDVETAPCGHCSHCVRGRVTLPARSQAEGDLDAFVADQTPALRSLATQFPNALGMPRQMARFLCGLSSPAAGAARVGRHALAGRLEAFRFPDVLKALDRDVL